MYFVVFFFLILQSLLLIMFYLMLLMKNFFVIMEVNLMMKMKILDLTFYLFFDDMSLMFLFMVSIISAMIIMYSSVYMEDDKNKYKFLLIMVMFILSMMIMVMCPNMLMIMLGWDGLGMVSYCLVMFYSNELSNYSSMITVMTNRLGDIGMLMSIVFFLNFYSWGMKELMMSNNKVNLIFVMMIFLGALTKSAQVPFSVWLPAAMAAPTPVSSLVHSSTLVTAGVYLLIRMEMMFEESTKLSEFLLIVSLMTMMISGFCALMETDVKKIIAMSTLSQLGVMMMVVSMMQMNLVFFHLVMHAFFKAMLFMGAGILIHETLGWQDIRNLSNSGWSSGMTLSMMILGSMSLSGLPFLSGFYSKDLILEFMYFVNNSMILMLMLIISTMLTLLYSLRMVYYLIIVKEYVSFNLNISEKENMVSSMLVLCILTILSGCMMSWMSMEECVFLLMSKKILNLGIIMGTFILFFFLKDMLKMLCENLFPVMFFLEKGTLVLNKMMFNPMNVSIKVMDMGWMESLKGGGSYKDLFFFSERQNFYYMLDSKIYIIIGLVMIYIMLL